MDINLKKNTLKVKKKLEKKLNGKKASTILKNYDKEIELLDKESIKLVDEYKMLLTKCFISKNTDKASNENIKIAIKNGITITKGKNVEEIYNNIKKIEQGIKNKNENKDKNIKELKKKLKDKAESIKKKEASVNKLQELSKILKSTILPDQKMDKLDNFLKNLDNDTPDYLKNYVKTAKKKLTSINKDNKKIIKKPLPPPPGLGNKKNLPPPPGIKQKKKTKSDEQVLDEKYMKNVRIKIAANKIVKIAEDKGIMDKIINPELINFTGADRIIQRDVNKIAKDNLRKGKKIWITCSNECKKDLSNLLDKEVKLTAFMLKVLSECVIDTTKGQMPLVFTCNNKTKLTGQWENDKQYFNIEPLDNKTKQRRLIMGFGPSASGKTFWAENIIKLLKGSDKSFPKAFLSVDGGKVREISYMYQHIINEINKHPSILGFSNLVKAGIGGFFGGRSLFESSNVKKAIRKYLLEQSKGSNGSPVSLYVPETLGGCIPLKPCSNKYKDYIKITGDEKWIGLYIWQHKKPGDCDMPTGFKCLSCFVSGTSRELEEGKQYSTSAYSSSKYYGVTNMKNAPGGRIQIHNCGGQEACKKNKSTVIEFSINGKYLLDKDILEKDYNSRYIAEPSNDKEIQKQLKIAYKASEDPQEKKAIEKIMKAFKDKDKKGKGTPIPEWNPRKNATTETAATKTDDKKKNPPAPAKKESPPGLGNKKKLPPPPGIKQKKKTKKNVSKLAPSKREKNMERKKVDIVSANKKSKHIKKQMDINKLSKNKLKEKAIRNQTTKKKKSKKGGKKTRKRK